MSEALAQAKASLQVTIDVADNNAPINEREGNLEQAALERQTAAECREALALIEDELADIEKQMKDPKSDYWKGRLAEPKQKRYRELLRVKDTILTK